MTRVLSVAERFVYDLGLLIAGERVDMSDYVDPASAGRMIDAVRPALEAGAVTAPDFGEYAQVRIHGDVLDRSTPVWTTVEFEDRSARLDLSSGTPARRRIRVQLLLDSAIDHVLDHRIELVS